MGGARETDAAGGVEWEEGGKGETSAGGKQW